MGCIVTHLDTNYKEYIMWNDNQWCGFIWTNGNFFADTLVYVTCSTLTLEVKFINEI